MAPGSRLQELTAKYMQNPRRYFVPLANEYRKSNELDRAITLCREHLPSQPGHMSGHIVLGRAYFEKGDVEAAREVFMTSVALDDENLIALRHLGDIARSRGHVAEARQWYVRVLDADPQNEEIERIVRGLGDASDAAQTASGSAPSVSLASSPSVYRPAEPQLADERAAASSVVAPDAVSASDLSLGDSALFDPTPPGLRAITAPTAGDIAAVTATVLPPVPSRTLGTLDLSTLDQPTGAVEAQASLPGIEVDDGVGFIFDDVTALEDPAASGFASGPSLPSVDEADFSAGVQTPTQPANSIPLEEPDPLLTRPAFGALASFASWRSAQDRDTPSQQPSQSPAGTAPPTPQPEPEPVAADTSDLFWDAGTADSAPTAPEFVTETMAALYAQQGFLQQALNVYRTLADRSPWDTSLHEKILGLEAELSVGSGDKSLQEDADKALQFDALDDSDALGSEQPSVLEQMYDVSPPGRAESAVAAEFGVAWKPDGDVATPSEDDWFAEEAGGAGASDSAYAGGAMFGISTDAFGQPAVPAPSREPVADRVPAGQSAGSLTAVFGGATASAADETAADVLIALAAEMVGRLPKEAPTLPVPDILELPSAVAADEATGASPAPLLSFDRFFSGSGAPPRQRIDTPATRATSTPSFPAPAAPPSLSPTFGGVPVIPPPPAAVTPTSWASFDQFVPPANAPAPAPPPAANLARPPAVTPVLPPALVPPRPVPPRPVPPRPAQLPTSSSAVPAPYPSFSGMPLDAVAPPPLPADSGSPSRDVPPSSPEPDEQDKALPSEFHRWLEGLS